MNSDVPFGAWLKQQRRALDRSREQLAGQIGCSISLLEKLETGERRPSRQIAARIALCLAIPPEQRDAFLVAARAGRAPQERGQFPTPTVPTTLAPPHMSHLPAPMTSFIGREWEIATLAARLRTPEVRLLTLTGAGGVGKTRLALQIASTMHDAFPNGVWFVDLAPISDPVLVIFTIAQTLGVREQPGMSLVETLRAAQHEQQLLVLLDNFEQVVAAAPKLAQLLAGVPRLKLLITSREALRLSGEHVVVVAPLAVPDPALALAAEQLTQYAAVQLFVARAQATSEHFHLTDANASAVAAICARLDGLPLAIELAAAQIPLFPPTALLTRLEQRLPMLKRGPRDVPARQQTLRSTINWSYDLLTAAEQTLLRRLGVFVGGWTEAAADAVCNSEGDLPIDTLDGLASLIDKSLLRQAEGQDGELRFVLLETIREYALELLQAHGEAEVLRRRHAAYFLALVEAAETQRPDVTWAARVARLDAELDNLRAALAWSQATAGDARVGLRLAKELLYSWLRGGQWTEARSWLTRVLAHPQASERILARAQVLTYAGYMCAWLDDYAAAQAAFAESLAICEELGDIQERAWVLNRMGWLAREQGDTALAHARLEKSLELYRELGDSDGIIEGLNTLGEVAVIQENPARATMLLEESLALSRSVGYAIGTAWALNHLGHVAQLEHDYGRATQLHMESLAVFREFGEQQIGTPSAHQSLGECALAQDDLVGAQAWLSAGLEQFRKLGHQAGVARCLAGLGSMAGMSGRPAQAARVWGAADALRQAIGGRPDPAARATYERAVALARAQLGDEAFAAAWAAGAALTLEETIAEALAEA